MIKETISEEDIKKLEGNAEDCIKTRIRHITFCKTIVWLYYKFSTSKKSDYVTPLELSKFLKLTTSRSHIILTDLVKFELLRKKISGGNIVEFCPITNNHKMKLEKWISEAKKTLGI